MGEDIMPDSYHIRIYSVLAPCLFRVYSVLVPCLFRVCSVFAPCLLRVKFILTLDHTGPHPPTPSPILGEGVGG